MTIIRFGDRAAKRRAMGFLFGRFSCKSWATGEMIVPEEALAALDAEGIAYTIEGPASRERLFYPLLTSEDIDLSRRETWGAFPGGDIV